MESRRRWLNTIYINPQSGGSTISHTGANGKVQDANLLFCMKTKEIGHGGGASLGFADCASNTFRLMLFQETGGGGVPTYNFVKFSQNCKKLRKILAWGHPLRSATGNNQKFNWNYSFGTFYSSWILYKKQPDSQELTPKFVILQIIAYVIKFKEKKFKKSSHGYRFLWGGGILIFFGHLFSQPAGRS